jgi:hypothetical protein
MRLLEKMYSHYPINGGDNDSKSQNVGNSNCRCRRLQISKKLSDINIDMWREICEKCVPKTKAIKSSLLLPCSLLSDQSKTIFKASVTLPLAKN